MPHLAMFTSKSVLFFYSLIPAVSGVCLYNFKVITELIDLLSENQSTSLSSYR